MTESIATPMIAESTDSTVEDAEAEQSQSESGRDLLEDGEDWLTKAESELEKVANTGIKQSNAAGTSGAAEDDFILPAIAVEEETDGDLNRFFDKEKSSTSDMGALSDPMKVDDSNSFITDTLALISRVDWSDYIKYGVLFLLVLGLGIFIKKKADSLSRQNNPHYGQQFGPQNTQGRFNPNGYPEQPVQGRAQSNLIGLGG